MLHRDVPTAQSCSPLPAGKDRSSITQMNYDPESCSWAEKINISTITLHYLYREQEMNKKLYF